MDTNLYRRILQARREAHYMLLQVASQLETFSSAADWSNWLGNYHAKSQSNTYVSFINGGVLIELYADTMTLTAYKGFGAIATARYLLPLTERDNLRQALRTRNNKEKKHEE